MIERVRWDRVKGKWGVLDYDPNLIMLELCKYKSHFEFGVMSNVATYVGPIHIRGCAPHTSIVGWSEGELSESESMHDVRTDRLLQCKFDGSDFFAGTKLVKECKYMFLFRDGTSLVEL